MSVNRDPQIGSVDHPNFAHQLRNELRDHAREINQLKLYSPAAIENSANKAQFSTLPVEGDYVGQLKWNYATSKPCWWTGAIWITVATVPA